MVETQKMKNGGVPVVNGDSVFDSFVTVVVADSVAQAALQAATGHPTRKGFVVMISSIIALRVGRATEFAGPDDQRILEHAARFQIG